MDTIQSFNDRSTGIAFQEFLESRNPVFRLDNPDENEVESRNPVFRLDNPDINEVESSNSVFRLDNPDKNEVESRNWVFRLDNPDKNEVESRNPVFRQDNPDKNEVESRNPVFRLDNPDKNEFMKSQAQAKEALRWLTHGDAVDVMIKSHLAGLQIDDLESFLLHKSSQFSTESNSSEHERSEHSVNILDNSSNQSSVSSR